MTGSRKRKSEGRGNATIPITVRLLGVPEWQAAGAAPVRLSAKDAALLTRLALDGPQSRHKLCELLWPDSPPDKGYSSLRTRAHRLKLAAKASLIEIDDSIRLAESMTVDLHVIDHMDTSGLMNAGPLLAGIDLGDHEELDRWLGRMRQQVAARCAEVLLARGQVFERDGRLEEAMSLARRAVEIAPLSEVSWLRLMTLQYLCGDRAAAQDTYYRCARVLRDEIGARVAAPMRDLMQVVEAADRAPVARQQPMPASVLRPPRLVGRVQAWQALWAAWQQGSPYLLAAEAGLGKSRLLEEFCQDQQGIVAERAAPGDEEDSYRLLGRLLVRIDSQFEPALAPADRTELARLRPEFGAQPEAPPNRSVLLHALESLLAASLGRGLRAIVLDDLHNADPSTLHVLRWLSGRPALAALRMGLATRPDGPKANMKVLSDWGSDSHRLVRIELTPLSREELAEFLASLMLPTLIDPRFIERMYHHAGGHPLYTLATLQAALQKGEDPLISQLPRPSSIQALLDARIQALPPESQALLRVAAIAGQDLAADRVARILECPVPALAERWATLEAAGILSAETFSHDLMHEAALRTVPYGVRQALHRQFAAVLAADDAATPARLAWHWEQGARPLEAARCWHEAARRAAAVALLSERNEMYARAARHYEAAGDVSGRFEALCERLEGLQLRPGGAAVLDALPEVEALADTGLRRLRCALARAEALLGLEREHEAEAVARTAVADASAYPSLMGDAEVLHAQALVQCRRFDSALAAASRAQATADSVGNPWQRLRVLQGASFVSYAVGRVPDALLRQRQAVALAESIGHRYEAAAGEGHSAALLAVIGDVPATHAQALRAATRLQAVGIDQDGVFGSVNYRVLGMAAAALGRFNEALESLQCAVDAAGASSGAMVRARLALATLWLTLGRPDRVRATLHNMPPDQEPARQAQRNLLLAQAADFEGLPSKEHWAALTQIGQEHAELPLMRSAVFELSYQGTPAEAIQRLRAAQRELTSLELAGTARSVLWRELVRWLEIPGAEATEAAWQAAQQLEPHLPIGLSARCHPPEVLCTLAQAFGRAGQPELLAKCFRRARQWLESALATVPDEFRESFILGHPLHRQLWGTGDS